MSQFNLVGECSMVPIACSARLCAASTRKGSRYSSIWQPYKEQEETRCCALYFEKVSAPSPLQNTPLAGKKLTIQYKNRESNFLADENMDLSINEPSLCSNSSKKLYNHRESYVDFSSLAYNRNMTPIPPLVNDVSDSSNIPSNLPLIKACPADKISPPSKAMNSHDLSVNNVMHPNKIKPQISMDKSGGLKNKRCSTEPMSVQGAKLSAKQPKVQYSRGVTPSGALFAICSHPPYKKRIRGATQNLSVKQQYIICYDGNKSTSEQQKVGLLFTSPSTLDNNNETAPFLKLIPSKINAREEKVKTKFKKGRKNAAKIKSIQSNFEETDITSLACQQKKPKARKVYKKTSHSRPPLMHNDFPFHCFLLFQFENRQKVLDRLTKLPKRMEQNLAKIKENVTIERRRLSSRVKKMSMHMAIKSIGEQATRRKKGVNQVKSSVETGNYNANTMVGEQSMLTEKLLLEEEKEINASLKLLLENDKSNNITVKNVNHPLHNYLVTQVNSNMDAKSTNNNEYKPNNDVKLSRKSLLKYIYRENLPTKKGEQITFEPVVACRNKIQSHRVIAPHLTTPAVLPERYNPTLVSSAIARSCNIVNKDSCSEITQSGASPAHSILEKALLDKVSCEEKTCNYLSPKQELAKVKVKNLVNNIPIECLGKQKDFLQDKKISKPVNYYIEVKED